MEEYGGDMDHDWDLQAVVRGCSNNSQQFSRNFMETNARVENNMDIIAQQQGEFLFGSSPVSCGVIEGKGGLVSSDELQLLYQPFYSVPHHQEEALFAAAGEAQVKQEQGSLNAVGFDFDSITSNAPPPVLVAASSTRAAKSRKNQQKRVVKQMTADCLSADKWAWRKYGQKPIKGSPFPRSYYRCSSSKGCPARKQVERSSSDPHIFILTYTAEHSHAHPTRRNTLAGVTRKLSLPRKTSNGNCKSRPANMMVDLSSSSTQFVVQATDETLRHSSMPESMIKGGEDMTRDVEDNNNQVSNMMNEFDGLTSDVVSDCWFDELQASSSHWQDERSVANT